MVPRQPEVGGRGAGQEVTRIRLKVRKRHKSILFGACVLLFGLCVWFVLRNEKPEPTYDSKPLSYWLAEIGFFWDGDTNNANYRAIISLGTNTIPLLVDHLMDKIPGSRIRIANSLNKLGIRAPLDSIGHKQQVQWGAGNALRMLGPRSESALPLLVDAIHQDPTSPAWIGISCIGDEVSNNLPTVLREFNAPPYRTGLVSVLNAFTNSPELCVPILMDGLRDESVTVKCLSISSLRAFGTNASAAASLLLELRTNAHPTVSGSALKTLQVIQGGEDSGE